MTLHDWIDELCDALELEDAEVDEGLILDLARDAAHEVERPAAPITTFLVGYAAGLRGGAVEDIELLAGRAQALAEKWDKPSGFRDPVDVEVAVPDDSGVDHTGDELED